MSNEIKLVKKNKWWQLWVNPKTFNPNDPLTFQNGFAVEVDAVFDEDTIRKGADGIYAVGDQEFKITEDTTKFVSGRKLTFKEFWNFVLNKINGLFSRAVANENAIGAEVERATGAEQANANAITAETQRAKGAEQANTNAINDEKTARIADVGSVRTSVSGLQTDLDNETATRAAADNNLEQTKADKTETAALAQDISDTKTALGNVDASLELTQATVGAMQDEIFGDGGLDDQVKKIDGGADVDGSFRKGDAETLDEAKQFTTQAIAQSEARDMVGFFAFGRTLATSEFPAEANIDANAFDFLNNTQYIKSATGWEIGEPLDIGTNSEIEIAFMLDGVDIAQQSMAGKKVDGLWKDNTWQFISVGITDAEIDFDGDTIQARTSDGKYEVAPRAVTIAEDVVKFASGTNITFKVFWSGVLNKINGIISFITRASGFATFAQGTRADSAVQPDAIADMATNSDVDDKLAQKANQADFNSHVGNTNNPHNVTKAQLGLDNVPNIDATDASNISTGTIDKNRLPEITKSDVGLSNVDNTSDAEKPLSDDAVSALADKASNADLADETERSTTAENTLSQNLSHEISRATGAESEIKNIVNFDAVQLDAQNIDAIVENFQNNTTSISIYSVDQFSWMLADWYRRNKHVERDPISPSEWRFALVGLFSPLITSETSDDAITLTQGVI